MPTVEEIDDVLTYMLMREVSIKDLCLRITAVEHPRYRAEVQRQIKGWLYENPNTVESR